MHLRKDISPAEFIICLLTWSLALFYSIYCFAVTADNNFRNYLDLYGDFNNNWFFISRRKDEADHEWLIIKLLLEKAIWYFFLASFVSEIFRQLNFYRLIPVWQLFISLSFLVLHFGAPATGSLLAQPILYFVILKIGKTRAIWITNIFSLGALTILGEYLYDGTFFNMGITNILFLELVSALHWMNLRCLSYCIDSINNKEKGNLLNMLSYCFYTPLVLTGPFISYDDFKPCYQVHRICDSRLKNLIAELLRVIFWFFFTDFFLHYIYVNAMIHHIEWIQKFDLWSLCGYGYTMGQYFHLKYIIQYGLTTSFAKFDNIVVPDWPICVGRVHLYSDMWKFFDNGLYKFLLRYMHIPLKRTLKSHTLSSMICFTFIYVWHGTYKLVFVWVISNYIAVSIEHISKLIYHAYLENSSLLNKIGDRWFRRITCFLAAPLFITSAISNFVFLSTYEIGTVFVFKLFNVSARSILVLLLIIYTMNQISTEFRSETSIFCKEKKHPKAKVK